MINSVKWYANRLVQDKDNRLVTDEQINKWDNITIPEALKSPNAIKIQLNGTEAASYDGSVEKVINITPAAIGAAATSDIPVIPEALKNPNAIVIKLNGTEAALYDGSAAKELDITAKAIGAVTSDDLVKTVTDWNTATAAGQYVSAASATNCPVTTAAAGNVTVIGNLIVQQVYQEDSSEDELVYFIRKGFKSESTVKWTQWFETTLEFEKV